MTKKKEEQHRGKNSAKAPRRRLKAHWLIDHRGQHDVNTADRGRVTALHWACVHGLLSLVEALVASGADPAVTDVCLSTPLMEASNYGRSDIVAYLLRLPSVQDTIDTIDEHGRTALSYASSRGSIPSVELLLDAGADPTIHAGRCRSPLNQAVSGGHTDVAALLRHAINEPDRAHTLHKARALPDAAIVINKARRDAHDGGHAPAVQRQQTIAAAPVYLKGRVKRGKTLPVPELAPQREDERLRATAAFVLGLEEGGVGYAGLPREVYVDLLGYLLPAWVDKGRARRRRQQQQQA